MKKSLIVALIFSLAIVGIVLLSWHLGYNNGQNQMIDHCYPLAGIVTDIDCAADTVTVTDCAGLSWTFIGTEDWYEGDIASCVMHDNGTPKSVYDDTIVKAYYAGIIEDNTFWISDK